MKSAQPYQPLLLRILHGVTGLLLVMAILSAFWTYNTYDGRWGTIPLPRYEEIEGIHGTFGLYTLLIFPALVLYSFHRGQRRLMKPDEALNLTAQVGKPIWWYTLSRMSNTATLLALTFALVSGKMMDDQWLPQGELDHFWYYGHLISWGVMVVAIALHLLMNAKVGGIPFLGSMLTSKFRPQDSPGLWKNHITFWWSNLNLNSWANLRQAIPHAMRAISQRPKLELIIWASLIVAWVISLSKELWSLL